MRFKLYMYIVYVYAQRGLITGASNVFFYQEQLRAFELGQGRGRLQERSGRKNENDLLQRKQKKTKWQKQQWKKQRQAFNLTTPAVELKESARARPEVGLDNDGKKK